jgi:hypothetical protein
VGEYISYANKLEPQFPLINCKKTKTKPNTINCINLKSLLNIATADNYFDQDVFTLDSILLKVYFSKKKELINFEEPEVTPRTLLYISCV